VLCAREGREALRELEEVGGAVNLVLTDIVMPGMSGPVLAQRLVSRWPELKVLYMSGYADQAIERQGALPAGGALLEKPFTARQLADRVRQALSKVET
jgi:two-component system, cell cycle sensor histidine kinase and response regulator CckA